MVEQNKRSSRLGKKSLLSNFRNAHDPPPMTSPAAFRNSRSFLQMR
jgi:hypothetical protein